VLAPGPLYIEACAFRNWGAVGPYSRPDGGGDVICVQAVQTLMAGSDLAVQLTW
jgi:hypothetical protein